MSIKLKYTLPAEENMGHKGQLVKTVETMTFDGIDSENLVSEINDLHSQGYDLDVTVKVKEPKE